MHHARCALECGAPIRLRPDIAHRDGAGGRAAAAAAHRPPHAAPGGAERLAQSAAYETVGAGYQHRVFGTHLTRRKVRDRTGEPDSRVGPALSPSVEPGPVLNVVCMIPRPSRRRSAVIAPCVGYTRTRRPLRVSPAIPALSGGEHGDARS